MSQSYDGPYVYTAAQCSSITVIDQTL